MATLSSLSSLSLLFLSLLSPYLCFSATTFSDDYLKLPLHHRRDPLQNPSQAIISDTRRLFTLFYAVHHVVSPPKHPSLPVTSGATTGSGQYFVDFSLGTPPQSLRLVADTGSDLVWVTCSACRNCSGHLPHTAFLARHSATFSPLHCFDSACQLVPQPKGVGCNRTRRHSPCRYSYSYSDGSITGGFFSRETVTLNASSGGRAMKQRNVAFGCSFQVSGPSLTGRSFNGAHGVMGMGRGPISFPYQLGRRFGHKFSYCLLDYTLSPPPTSFLLIGKTPNGVVKRLSYTPLLINPISPTFYYIGIESVFVDELKLQINPSVWAIDESGNGGTILDSGSTLTFLAQSAYARILTEFKRRVRLPSPAKPTPGPRFDLCVNVSGVSTPGLPRLSFRLSGGTVFSPPTGNYFIDTAQGVKCLALQPVASPSGFSVIGNLMQQGFLFEFDNKRSRLGFSRHGCAVPLTH